MINATQVKTLNVKKRVDFLYIYFIAHMRRLPPEDASVKSLLSSSYEYKALKEGKTQQYILLFRHFKAKDLVTWFTNKHIPD